MYLLLLSEFLCTYKHNTHKTHLYFSSSKIFNLIYLPHKVTCSLHDHTTFPKLPSPTSLSVSNPPTIKQNRNPSDQTQPNSMEALTFLKFWKPSSESFNLVQDVEDDGDDSFFELELSVSDRQQQQHVQTTSSDVLSKRKILPIEPTSNTSTSKPQSPISLLKSAPNKLNISIFRKQRPVMDSKTEEAKNRAGQKQSLFTLKFELQRQQCQKRNVSVFNRVWSLRKSPNDNESLQSYDSCSSSTSTSKRFSKEAIGRYLKLIKVNKNQKGTPPSPSQSPAASPATVAFQSPKQSTSTGFRAVSRHLGKSKSASSSLTSSTAARRDDSLLLYNDGIQSAILHCKKSFNSSRGKFLYFKKN